MSTKPRVDKIQIALDTKVQRLIKLYRMVRQDQKEEALALIKEMGQIARRESVARSESRKSRKTIC